jgi:type VI secretion system protein ImpK
MTPKFSSAVDPVFLHVLGLLDRIARDENPSPVQERQGIRGWLDQAEGRLGKSQEWQLAKYALASWIDEVLVGGTWLGRGWWRENTLEDEFFHTHARHDQFYAKAREAALLPRTDALETFYLCVVLGFRGLYRDPVAAIALAQRRQLPPDVETWARKTAAAIPIGQERPPITTDSQPLSGAAPLRGRLMLTCASLLGVALTVSLAIAAWWCLLPTKS